MERPQTSYKTRNLTLTVLDLILYAMLLNIFGNIHSIGEIIVYVCLVLYSMARAGIYLVKAVKAIYRSWNIIKKVCKDITSQK